MQGRLTKRIGGYCNHCAKAFRRSRREQKFCAKQYRTKFYAKQSQRRWRRKNRKKWNSYMRAFNESRREAGIKWWVVKNAVDNKAEAR